MTTAVAIGIVVGVSAVKMIGVGVCLGLGFWMAKKATSRVDRWALENDEDYLKSLLPSADDD